MKYDGKVAVSIEFVTPEIAAHYLSFNNSNALKSGNKKPPPKPGGGKNRKGNRGQ